MDACSPLALTLALALALALILPLDIGKVSPIKGMLFLALTAREEAAPLEKPA
jgi:hypothetical protein